MTYKEVIDYLYSAAPLFQNIGAGAYKEGLYNTHQLDAHFGHPHQAYKTIHIGGTNGKGSCSHTLAAILMAAGYRVGLYTSPHLVDFRERIRVNGKMIPQQRVIDFVEQERNFFEPLHPSFFELTTALALTYFKEEKVDIAVIEVGLGGRLDCTNIISPILSVITNISFDHTQFLGHTLQAIATEKAGIIKPSTPVVIGETGNNAEVRGVFSDAANKVNAPIHFACEQPVVTGSTPEKNGRRYQLQNGETLYGGLGGLCQEKNTNTILCAVNELQTAGISIKDADIRQGFAHLCEMTGLMGRWQHLEGCDVPTVCDTGHNTGGIQYIVQQLSSVRCAHLRIVFGMVSDKDVNTVLTMLPKDAIYYFTQASVKRAMPSKELAQKAHECGLEGNAYPTVEAAYSEARKDASKEDFIFIGGSSFIVADLLSLENI